MTCSALQPRVAVHDAIPSRAAWLAAPPAGAGTAGEARRAAPQAPRGQRSAAPRSASSTRSARPSMKAVGRADRRHPDIAGHAQLSAPGRGIRCRARPGSRNARRRRRSAPPRPPTPSAAARSQLLLGRRADPFQRPDPALIADDVIQSVEAAQPRHHRRHRRLDLPLVGIAAWRSTCFGRPWAENSTPQARPAAPAPRPAARGSARRCAVDEAAARSDSSRRRASARPARPRGGARASRFSDEPVVVVENCG